jgi:hypothetical protein
VTGRPLPAPEDDHDLKILGDIERVGWSVIGIEEDDNGPGYCFSLGIYHTLGHPEILLMGLKPVIAARLINDMGDAVRAGRRFEPGCQDEDLASFPLHFIAVDRALYRKYVGYARWLYRGSDFPLLQCVWPDKQGVFPWQEGFDARFFQVQRLLGAAGSLPHGWLFAEPPNQATFSVRQVFHEGKPILYVVHDSEGAWQFLTGDRVEMPDALVVALAEPVRIDPSVAELADLPCGWRASRPGIGEPWQREPHPAKEC